MAWTLHESRLWVVDHPVANKNKSAISPVLGKQKSRASKARRGCGVLPG